MPLRAALVAGIALGLVGRLSDYAAYPVRAAFVLGAPWIVTAVCIGLFARDRREGLRAGALGLAVSVVVYYALMTAVEHNVSGRYAVAMALGWGVVALAIGALFGVAGADLQSRSASTRARAAVLIGGALAGEALLFLLRGVPTSFALVLAAQLILGIAVVVTVAGSHRSLRLLAVTAAVATSALVIDLAVRDVLRVYGWGGI
jgi:hypothetical protein